MSFVSWGYRVFSDNRFHRVAFQPVLYLIVWSGVLRIVVTDAPPIRFDVLGPWVYGGWAAMGLVCPPLALLSWWLIVRSSWRLSTLLGTYLRLSADLGMFFTLLAFHLAGALDDGDGCPHNLEESVFTRYLVASILVFNLSLVVRDVWSIAAINAAAKRLGR